MRVEFEGQKYIVSFIHNTLDSFLRNLNVVYGNPKMGVHSASGKDLQQSVNRKAIKCAYKPLMRHFKFELGTFCMIKKWEENRDEIPTFAQEDPLAFEFTKLSKKDNYIKKVGRKEALDKALRVMFPKDNKSFKEFKRLVMEACIKKGQKKTTELAVTTNAS